MSSRYSRLKTTSMTRYSKPTLTVTGLRNKYPGAEGETLKDVSFSAYAGEVVGIVGINGAGKTTLLKMCATFLTPQTGSIEIVGIDAVVKPTAARSNVGVVFSVEKGFYPRATVLNNLKFFADLARVPARRQAEEIHRVLELVGLTEKEHVKASSLSHGQKQRLHIARALLGSPPLLLLDEPTSGLDPNVALKIRNLLRIIADQGTAVVLTSHSMVEVAELCDKTIVLNNGSVLVSGSQQDIFDFARLKHVLQFTIAPESEDLLEALRQVAEPFGTFDAKPIGAQWRISIYAPDSTYELESVLAEILKDQAEIISRKPTLEDAFLALAKQVD